MTHMDRTSMYGIRGVHISRFESRARVPDLVLSHRETPRRYASMAQTGVFRADHGRASTL